MPEKDVAAEVAELRVAVTNASDAFQMLENGLASLLQGVLGNLQKGFGLAIYFATDSAYTRFAVVNQAVIEFFYQEPHQDGAMKAWEELFGRINNVKTGRNVLAHSSVQAPVVRGTQHVRLLGPMFKLGKYKDGTRLPAEGWSLKDVIALHERIGRCVHGVHLFTAIVASTQMKNHDGPTLQRICVELAEHLRSGSLLPFAPTPPILPSPRQSSEA